MRKEDLYIEDENYPSYNIDANSNTLSKVLYKKFKLIQKIYNSCYIINNKNGIYYKILFDTDKNDNNKKKHP